MSTNWALPTTISQYSEQSAENAHIRWDDVNNFSSLKYSDGKFVKTERDLLHIAREPKHDITEKTYYLRLTGFTFTNIPNIISGVEMRLTMNRFGRISDDTVQLCLNGDVIGNNFADVNLEPITVYGSNSDLWDSNINLISIQDASFGVVLRFKSHPLWPHKHSALIDSVEIRVH